MVVSCHHSADVCLVICKTTATSVAGTGSFQSGYATGSSGAGAGFPFLLLANLLLRPQSVKRYLGKEAGLKGWFASVVAGILSMGPIYAWYPVLSELKNKGMRTALIATFLYSRAVKLPLLPLMIYYFGPVFTLMLCVYLIIFSIINGAIVEKLMQQQSCESRDDLQEDL